MTAVMTCPLSITCQPLLAATASKTDRQTDGNNKLTVNTAVHDARLSVNVHYSVTTVVPLDRPALSPVSCSLAAVHASTAQQRVAGDNKESSIITMQRPPTAHCSRAPAGSVYSVWPKVSRLTNVALTYRIENASQLQKTFFSTHTHTHTRKNKQMLTGTVSNIFCGKSLTSYYCRNSTWNHACTYTDFEYIQLSAIS